MDTIPKCFFEQTKHNVIDLLIGYILEVGIPLKSKNQNPPRLAADYEFVAMNSHSLCLAVCGSMLLRQP